MNISATKNESAFGAKIINNKAFEEVVRYAEQNAKIKELDIALNNLKNANSGDLLIIHGKAPNGIFSSFNMNKRSVQNLSNGAVSPEEASFNALLELGELGRKFRKLIGGNVEYKLKAEDLIKRYGIS